MTKLQKANLGEIRKTESVLVETPSTVKGGVLLSSPVGMSQMAAITPWPQSESWTKTQRAADQKERDATVTRVYVPRFFVSSQQRFGVTDIKAPSACHSSQVLDRQCYSSQVLNGLCYSSLDKSVLQLTVTALFYLEDSRKIHLWGMRARGYKDMRRRAPQHVGERERELALALLFICLFLPGPVLCKLGQPGVLFILPEVITLVLGPSFFPFSRAFPFLVWWPPSFWTPFPCSTYLTIPCSK